MQQVSNASDDDWIVEFRGCDQRKEVGALQVVAKQRRRRLSTRCTQHSLGVFRAGYPAKAILSHPIHIRRDGRANHEHSDLGEGASQLLDESQRPIGIGNLEDPASAMGIGQFRQGHALDVAIRTFVGTKHLEAAALAQ